MSRTCRRTLLPLWFFAEKGLLTYFHFKKKKSGSCCCGGELLNRRSTVMNFGLIPTLKRCFPAFGMWFGACIHVNKSPEARQWQDGLGCSGLTQLQLKSTQFKMDLTFPTTVSSEAKQAYFLIRQPQNAYFKHISQWRPPETLKCKKYCGWNVF